MRESLSRYKQRLGLRDMRNKILRSANTKYHFSYLFFYKINKGDLPLMLACENILSPRSLPACRRLLFPLLHAEKGRLRNAVANRVPAFGGQGIGYLA